MICGISWDGSAGIHLGVSSPWARATRTFCGKDVPEQHRLYIVWQPEMVFCPECETEAFRA